MTIRKHAFLEAVKGQINSKEAKEFVTAELDYHIKESKNEWMKKGLSEKVAEEKAVNHMGSPIKLGQQLNKLHRPRIDLVLIALLVTCLGLGFLPIFTGQYIDVQNKIIFVILGGAASISIMLIDYRKLKNFGWGFYAIGILILYAIPSISNITINGNYAIKIGWITIESLMAIPFFFLAFATFFNNCSFKIWQFGTLFLFPFYLFFTIPSISSAYIYLVMVFVMLGWSKFARQIIFSIYGIASASFLICLFFIWRFSSGYWKMRLLAVLTPEKYSTDAGYMILQVKELLSKAGWYGNSESSELIPDATTNFVFVSLTYYYGWIFAAVIVMILSLFAARIAAVIPKIDDSYGKLLLIGAVAVFTTQVVSNIGMAIGFFPLTAMSLPFISYGLMPVLMNAVLIGIVLSVYRRKDLVSRRVV